jgi:hypothetical protein
VPEFEAKLESRGGGVVAVVPFDVKDAFGRARAPVNVRWIEEAKREDTRRTRAEKAIEMLRERVQTPG